ncbi:uncharacterized protein LOC119675665 [Teleopsis dalmanni]|uniref:uncharacterized protein LOC119675665 n=1 Tax=Teleopsis dalmanni TaxID=139649 RepID=UPI0018CCCC65|nr:uncharacterized protein LOC119675665 [Teleopsis dalmanni]
MKKILYWLILCYVPYIEALLYPASSNLGLTASVSVPVTELLPERKLIIDWCFNMGYDLPYTVAQFYNIPIWPGFQNPKSKREIQEKSVTKLQKLYGKYDKKTDANRHPNDFSAGELYQGIEDYLVNYGFHETCVLKTVCNLAQHPFDDEHQNIVTDIVTFFLTPSLHQGFDTSEQIYREAYETAEMSGFLGEDCNKIYADCTMDLLNSFSKVLFLNG